MPSGGSIIGNLVSEILTIYYARVIARVFVANDSIFFLDSFDYCVRLLIIFSG